MRIAFIVGKRQRSEPVFPLGAGYLISILKKDGHDVSTLILNNVDEQYLEDTIKQFIAKTNPQIAMLSGFSAYWYSVDMAAKAIRKIHKNIKIISGGPLFISQSHLAMENIPEIDIACLGEGEPIISQIVNGIDSEFSLRNIPGIMYRNGNQLVTTGHPIFVDDLDSIPFPDYEAVEYKLYLEKQFEHQKRLRNCVYHIIYERKGVILGGRGCPYTCTFCYRTTGKKYRLRSLDNIFSELEYQISNYNIDHIWMLDDLFAIKRDRVFEFCKRIKDYKISWSASLRVDQIQTDMLDAMHDSNLTNLCLGIESADDNTLKSLKKKISVDQINRALALCKERRVNAFGNIIIGDQNETVESTLNSIDWMRKNNYFNIVPGFIMHIPNSELYNIALNNGKIADEIRHNIDYFPIINMTKMSDEEFGLVDTAIRPTVS